MGRTPTGAMVQAYRPSGPTFVIRRTYPWLRPGTAVSGAVGALW